MLIDRFDVRAHLDYIPENPPHTESTTNEELSREDRLANYERYRIIVQNEFLGSKSRRFIYIQPSLNHTADPVVCVVSHTVGIMFVSWLQISCAFPWHIS